jgi:predicted amidohydrolase
MTKKLVKTARGLEIDMGAIELKNEHVRAVGNMNVNARGDTIDSTGQIIEHKNVRAEKFVEKQVSNVSDSPVATSSKK